MFCSSSESWSWYQRWWTGSKEKGMVIGISALFRSRREEYGFTKYLKPGRGYWWIKGMKKGTLIKELWVNGGKPADISYKNYSMQRKQDSWNHPAKRRRFKDLEDWSSFSLGVEGELQCLLMYLEHKSKRAIPRQFTAYPNEIGSREAEGELPQIL